MPVPATDAIASDVGHGALGLRDALRPVTELLGETSGQRQVWAELRPAKLLTGWSYDGSGVYVVAFPAVTWDGIVRDVVGVKTASETLVRVETLALCQAATGSYYFARGSTTAPTWDSGATWDSGVLWDQGPLLYVHLTSGADANATDIVAQLGLFVGTHGVWHPTLGPEKLVNGGFETWTSSTDAGTWTEGATTGWTITRESSIVKSGTYSAKLACGAVAGGDEYAELIVDMTLVVGETYRLCGDYRTDGDTLGDARFFVMISNTAVTSFLWSDGRSQSAAGNGLGVSNTSGEWRRFVIDFVAFETTLRLRLRFWSGGSPAVGQACYLDNISLRRVYRYEFFEPLLTIDGAPTLEAARQDAYFGPVSVGLGGLSLANGNGRFESLLSLYDWTGQEAIIRLGGRFPNGGNEVLLDDCRIVAVGLMSEPVVTDSRVSVQLEDARQVLRRDVQTRYYTTTEFPALAERDQGRVRPLIFGTVRNILPARIAINDSTYGTYEVADVEGSPAGLKLWGLVSTFEVRTYLSEEIALRREPDPVSGSPYGWVNDSTFVGNVATGQFSDSEDVLAVRLDYGQTAIDFDIGGGSLLANVTPGIWTLEGWGEYILEDRMNTVAGTTDITVTLDPITHKFTIAKGAGTLNLLCGTGANRDNGMWSILGFNPTSDRTGALTYTADVPVSYGVEQHVLRVNAKGFADDSSGTYTGTPSAIIEKAPDVALYILNRRLGIPFASIDLASFAAARSTNTASLSVYLGVLGSGSGSAVTAWEVLEKIENGAGADIVLEGDTWYWRTRDTSVPSDVVDVYDYDILYWEAGYNAEDHYSVICVGFDQDPVSGNYSVIQETRSEAAVRFGRPNQRTFHTYLATEADAAARLTALAAEASAKKRRFRFVAKGKLLLTPVGRKVRITRTKGLGDSGALSSVLCRIIRKSDSIGGWVSTVEAIEVV